MKCTLGSVLLNFVPKYSIGTVRDLFARARKGFMTKNGFEAYEPIFNRFNIRSLCQITEGPPPLLTYAPLLNLLPAMYANVVGYILKNALSSHWFILYNDLSSRPSHLAWLQSLIYEP